MTFSRAAIQERSHICGPIDIWHVHPVQLNKNLTFVKYRFPGKKFHSPLEFAWQINVHGILWFAAARGGSSSSDLDFLEAPPPYNSGFGSSPFGNPTYGAGLRSGFSGECACRLRLSFKSLVLTFIVHVLKRYKNNILAETKSPCSSSYAHSLSCKSVGTGVKIIIFSF